jgi:LacI family repressor for deo operon, udp, cdd, tsx, nupC, and nupG
MSTITAVAKKAEVSRYINSPKSVSTKTAKKVEKAIQELQYVPNISARNLRKLKSGAILVVVPDIAEPSFSQIIMGINEASRELGYYTLISQSKSEKSSELENFELLQL